MDLILFKFFFHIERLTFNPIKKGFQSATSKQNINFVIFDPFKLNEKHFSPGQCFKGKISSKISIIHSLIFIFFAFVLSVKGQRTLIKHFLLFRRMFFFFNILFDTYAASSVRVFVLFLLLHVLSIRP